jgi:Uma2 family endonuclease
MTIEDFLAWDDGTDTRYELVAGEVVAMAPPNEAHGVIAANLIGEVRARLKSPCRVVSEAGVRCSGRNDAYYQADAVVTCLPPVPGSQLPSEPTVIFEILSPSTAAHDRGTKVPDYRTIQSVREIVLVSATEVKAEVWRRGGNGWTVSDLAGSEAVLRLEAVDIEVPLVAFYEGVALEPAATGSAAGEG